MYSYASAALPASPLSALLTLLLPAIILYAFVRAIHLLFFHPLAAIPGPWYAAISHFWLTTHVLRLQQCQTIHSLFAKYGPVVRVGPNKVVFCDVGAMRSVYSVWKFDKSSYYKSLLTNENDHAMTTLPHAQHTIRRKAYAAHYTPSNIGKFQPEIREIVSGLVGTLNSLPSHTAVETLSLLRHLFVDVIVQSEFGYRLGSIERWAHQVHEEESLSTAISDFPKRGVLRSAVPTWAWNLVCKVPNARWRLMCDSDKIMAEFVSARVYEMRAQMNAGKIPQLTSTASPSTSPAASPIVGSSPVTSSFSSGHDRGLSSPALGFCHSRSPSPAPSTFSDDGEETTKTPMLQRLLGFKYTGGEQIPDKDVISECMGHMIAGSDTSSTSLSYFLWELTRRPDILHKLQQEIDEAMPDPNVVPDIKVLNSLEYLGAFVKEGLRLYAAAPSLLERVVPLSTSKNFSGVDGFDLMGYALPPGTIVSTQAWSMHRDAGVFPSPETFLPERWLPSYSSSANDDAEVDTELREREKERLARMAQHMMPFGTGSRVCGGQVLAGVMMKIVLVALLRNFEFEAAEGTDEGSMGIRDSFVIFPAAMECKLIFHSRVHA